MKASDGAKRLYELTQDTVCLLDSLIHNVHDASALPILLERLFGRERSFDFDAESARWEAMIRPVATENSFALREGNPEYYETTIESIVGLKHSIYQDCVLALTQSKAIDCPHPIHYFPQYNDTDEYEFIEVLLTADQRKALDAYKDETGLTDEEILLNGLKCTSVHTVWNPAHAKPIGAWLSALCFPNLQKLNFQAKREIRLATANPPMPNQAEAILADDSAFVSPSKLWQTRFDTYRKFQTWLQNTPEAKVRLRRPRKNRLEIHSGDWFSYWDAYDKAQFEAMDR